MSAPITEAHRRLACEVLMEHSVSGAATKDGVIAAAQLIADSEARAKESLLVAYDVVCEVRNRLTTERDQLRAEVINLTQSRDNWESACKANDACVVQLKARAERAEAELHQVACARTDGILRESDLEFRLRIERARLDWLEKRGPWESWNDAGETGITLRENIRAAIDAAMKKGAL